MTVIVTGVSPSIIPADGGYRLDVSGTFPQGERLNVHIGPTGTTADPLAYSGKPGQGGQVLAQSPTRVRVYAPILPVGGPYSVLVRSLDSVDADTFADALQATEPDHKTKVLASRSLFPPFYKTGPRNMEAFGPEGFDAVEKGLLEALTSAVGEADNEVGGMVQTRLTSPVTAGTVSFPVEITLGWSDSGKVSIDGVVYHYESKTLTSLDKITHQAGGASVAGARQDHHDRATVLDLQNPYSAVERVRRAMLVEHAQGEDLSALGRNLGVLRLPFLRDDDQFRSIVKALAYNPKGTVFGLDLALEAMVGPGQYEIYEDLIGFPNTVFIKLLAAAAVEDIATGKTFVGSEEYRPALTDTTVDIGSEPVVGGTVQGVRWKDEEILTDTRSQKPSAQTIEDFDGDPGTQVWEYVGADEATDVLVGTDEGGYVQFVAQADSWYRHLARIQPGSDVWLELLLSPRTLPAVIDPHAALAVHDTAKAIGVGVVWSGTPQRLWVGYFRPDVPAPAFTAVLDLSSTGGLFDLSPSDYFTVGLHKRGTEEIEIFVNGTLVLRRDQSFFLSSAENKIEIGNLHAIAQGPVDLRLRQVLLGIRTTTDYWASRGSAGTVATASPAQLDVNLPAHFQSGDAGKALVTRSSAVTNARGGNNNGTWQIQSVDSDEIVTLHGPGRTGASLQAAFPQRIEIVGADDAFQFPDDLGKKIVVEGSVLGNNGTYVIDRLLQVGTLVNLSSFATPLSEKTNICEVVSVSFVTESGLDWHLEPNFVDETGLAWEMSEAGSRTGTVLTLRQALPLAEAAGYNRTLAIVYTRVLSAQVLAESKVLNQVLQEDPPRHRYYPFYISDPLGYVRMYLDAITAAGVIPDFKIE